MSQKLLFIILPYLTDRRKEPSAKLRSYIAFPYGVLSIATYLEKHYQKSISIKIFDPNIYSTNWESYLFELVTRFKPEIVGISMMFDSSYKSLYGVTNIIKEIDSNITIVIGGAAATSSAYFILNKQPNIDAVCYYDGELPFARLIESKNKILFLINDSSWITRDSIKLQKKPKKSVLHSLDDVININYSFIETTKYGMREAFSPFTRNFDQNIQFFIHTSRGCPFNCSFCIHSSDEDKEIRYASVESVINHVRELVNNYGLNVLSIYDDQLLFNKKRAKEIFKGLKEFNIRVECPNGLSPAFIDDELAKLMKEAGMDTINLAIESGSPYVLNELIKKPLKLSVMEKIIRILRKYDFWVHGFFVTGMPGETDLHREETVNFIKKIGLDWSGFSLAFPSRGSILYKICLENKYIPQEVEIGDIDPNSYIINTTQYSKEYIVKQTYLMNLNVNFVNNYRMKIKDYELASKAFYEVILLYPEHAFAHYYYSKALESLGCFPEQSNKSLNEFYRIIRENNEWKDYADYFNLI